MTSVRLREGSEGLELVAPRIALGSTMLYHGASKLTSKGLQETSGMMEQLGFKPGKRWAALTGLAEVGAGVLSILGIGTRLAALAVLVTQTVAIDKVHREKGFSMMKGGYEFNLALMAIAAGLLLAGPGKLSLKDAVHSRKYRGLRGVMRHMFPDWKTRALHALQ